MQGDPIPEAIGYRSTGHAMQQAPTRPVGALLTWWSGEAGEVRLQITDDAGRLVGLLTCIDLVRWLAASDG